jgi:hypothetical protein
MAEKTIIQKMYLKTAKSLSVLNGAVNPYVMGQLPADKIDDSGEQTDVVLLFAPNMRDLAALLPQGLERLGEKGSLWIAFLKQTASKATDLERDIIHSYVKERGLTDVAMISLDGDWSALRLKRL